MTDWPFAFSTLGVPWVPVAEAVRLARAHGCDGLELRAHPDEEVSLDLSTKGRAEVRGRLADAGLALPCVAGYVRICSPVDGVLDELRRLLDLAADLGARAVRVFPGGNGDGGAGADNGDGGTGGDDERAHERLAAAVAEDPPARILVETHDSHPTGADVARLVRPFAARGVAAIWDVLHPWRNGEEPAGTLAALTGVLGYVQTKDARIKDARIKDAAPEPVPLGTGDVPLEECGRLLRDSGWTGWVSLEWEKAWHPRAAPLPEVLPGAVAWVRRHAPRGEG